jgi:hypothetical protein
MYCVVVHAEHVIGSQSRGLGCRSLCFADARTLLGGNPLALVAPSLCSKAWQKFYRARSSARGGGARRGTGNLTPYGKGQDLAWSQTS